MSTQAQLQQGGVGALLKQSREQRGMTTAEVASQLRLKVSQIEQIEAEQWDPAVSATFIRGYLRAYAKLMKLPEKEILANFELQAAYLRNQAKPMHSFSNKASLDAVDNRFMLASYLLVVLLIGLFLVWFWQTHLLDSQPVTALPELTVSSAETSEPEAAQQGTVDNALALENAAQGRVEQTQVVAPEQVSNDSQTEQLAATDVSAVNTTAAEQSVTATDTTTANNAAAGNTPQDSTAATLPSQPVASAIDAAQSVVTETDDTNSAATAGSAKLTLQFSAECWLEVTDANGKRMAYGIRQGGQNEVLTGTAPFKVILGNAAAAKVQLNDVAVDLSGYAAGRVARLTLGGQP